MRLSLQNGQQLHARTLEVSPRGMKMMSPMRLAKGQFCQVSFDIMINGDIKLVRAVSQTRESVCVGLDGFRTDLHFIDIDTHSLETIRHWLGYGR